MTRFIAPIALAAVVVVAAVVLFTGRKDDDYTVRVDFRNAAGLRTNSRVDVAGQPVGRVQTLKLDSRDHVIATLKLKRAAGPVRAQASAKVRPANLLGEKYVDLRLGRPRSAALASNSLIPAARTGAPVELDDVVNVLDAPTRTALSVLINESGIALTGRGRDFSDTLRALPPSLDRVGTLLNGLGRDNRALGSLVESSDRVVGSIATRRQSLGRLVGAADRALTATAVRDRELAQTLQRAPGALGQLRESLEQVQTTAVPLGQASDQLTSSAPSLTGLLRQVAPFSRAARPTLATASSVAPQLSRLGRRGTPSLRALRPVVSDLKTFSQPTFNRFSDTLEAGVPDTLGALEGWARAIQGRDGAGHLFRNDAGLTENTLKQLVNSLARQAPVSLTSTRKLDASRRSASAKARQTTPPATTSPDQGANPTSSQPAPADKQGATNVLDYLLGP